MYHNSHLKIDNRKKNILRKNDHAQKKSQTTFDHIVVNFDKTRK